MHVKRSTSKTASRALKNLFMAPPPKLHLLEQVSVLLSCLRNCFDFFCLQTSNGKDCRMKLSSDAFLESFNKPLRRTLQNCVETLACNIEHNIKKSRCLISILKICIRT